MKDYWDALDELEEAKRYAFRLQEELRLCSERIPKRDIPTLEEFLLNRTPKESGEEAIRAWLEFVNQERRRFPERDIAMACATLYDCHVSSSAYIHALKRVNEANEAFLREKHLLDEKHSRRSALRIGLAAGIALCIFVGSLIPRSFW